MTTGAQAGKRTRSRVRVSLALLCSCVSGLLALLGCARQGGNQPGWRPGMAMPRTDVTLLGVCLGFRVGTREGTPAKDSPRVALPDDTVWAYPVVKVTLGDRQLDTIYLANTARLECAGWGWNVRDKVRIWSPLKNEVKLEWYEVKPTRARFRRHAALSYRLQRLSTPEAGQPVDQWYREFSGHQGTMRLVVRAAYGTQSVTSGSVYSEAAVKEIPGISFRPDTFGIGWAATLLGSVPYRDGSSLEQTAGYLSCDSRSVVIYYLRHTCGRSLSGDTIPNRGDSGHVPSLDRTLDSAGQLVFKGYIRLGRLYDERGRRAHLRLGKDLRRGDVIHFTTLGSYGLVWDDHPPGGYSYGGIPARLPLLRAAQSYPQVQPFYTTLWSLRTLFGKSWFKVLRYEPIIRAAPPAKKKIVARPAPANKRRKHKP